MLEAYNSLFFILQEYTAVLADTLGFRLLTVSLVKPMVVFKVELVPFCSLRWPEAFAGQG